jgi:hypothetical protein
MLDWNSRKKSSFDIEERLNTRLNQTILSIRMTLAEEKNFSAATQMHLEYNRQMLMDRNWAEVEKGTKHLLVHGENSSDQTLVEDQLLWKIDWMRKFVDRSMDCH